MIEAVETGKNNDYGTDWEDILPRLFAVFDESGSPNTWTPRTPFEQFTANLWSMYQESKGGAAAPRPLVGRPFAEVADKVNLVGWYKWIVQPMAVGWLPVSALYHGVEDAKYWTQLVHVEEKRRRSGEVRDV